MKKNNKRTKFKTEYNRSEISEKAEPYDWVPKVQIFGACYLFFALMNIATEADIWWKGSLYGIGAICVVWFIVTGIFQQVRSYKIKTNKRIDNVKKQLVGFICDLYLGRISKEDIKRLGEAANVGWLRYDSQDLTQDDFNLIARAWFFWKDGNGFEWQDKTECLACGKERQEHEKDGTCPILT